MMSSKKENFCSLVCSVIIGTVDDFPESMVYLALILLNTSVDKCSILVYFLVL